MYQVYTLGINYELAGINYILLGTKFVFFVIKYVIFDFRHQLCTLYMYSRTYIVSISMCSVYLLLLVAIKRTKKAITIFFQVRDRG